jgi:ABC-type lipoprotein export system ATPase subunit
MYCFFGVLPHAGGELSVAGIDPYKLSPIELVHFQRKTVSMIYQAFYLIPSITVVDNVALPRTFVGESQAVRRKKAQDLLSRFGVGHIGDKWPTNISGGQSQRVSVSRSLINEPDIIFADEPVGNLDTKSSHQVMSTLEDINKRDKKNIILVSHDPALLRYAHRVIYLRDGRLERIVANPERKQIVPQEDKGVHDLVTEIEKLSRIYPYITQLELKAKSLVNYLTQDYNFEQLNKLETIILDTIQGKYHQKQLGKKLSESYKDGGIGAHKDTAERMAETIIKLLTDSRDIARYRRRVVNQAPVRSQRSLVRRLRKHLLAEYSGKPKAEQVKMLDEVIKARISGDISSEIFRQLLSAKVAEGGVGLSSASARNLSRYFEKLLAQGYKISN